MQNVSFFLKQVWKSLKRGWLSMWSFLGKNKLWFKKNWWVVVIILLLGYIYIERKKVNNLRDDLQIQRIENKTLIDDILTVKTKNGQLVSKINAIEVDKKNLKESLDAAGFDIKELRDANIKQRNIILALRAKIETVGTVNTTVTDTFFVNIDNPGIVIKDTTKGFKINNWSDGALSLFDGFISDDILSIDYKYRLGLDFVVENKRKGTLVTVMPAAPQTDIISANTSSPETSVISANSVFVKDKKKWFQRPLVWGVAGFVAGAFVVK